MDRIFNIGNNSPLRVIGDSNQIKLTRANDAAQNEIITKSYINEKCFYQDEFVAFPAKRLIEKKMSQGKAVIVFGDQFAYGTSAPEKYVRIEENGCKFAFKEGRSGKKGVYRIYGDVLGALKKEQAAQFSSNIAKKYAKVLKNMKLEKILKISR